MFTALARPVALVAFAAAAFAAPAAAEPPPDAVSWIYDPGAVSRIDLTLPQGSIDALEAEPDEYVPGTVELTGSGGHFGPLDAGIRLKGSGSFRRLVHKAAFKVKLDEYVDDQTLLGLEKLTLNNMVWDASTMAETLGYEAFRAAGIPASRTGYAFVTVNGEDYGLYLNLEVLDGVSLPRWLGSTRHLYEAGQEMDVVPGAAPAFEVDEGKGKDRADLEALIAAANDEAGDWSEGMAAVADLDEMTRMWAVERYIGHWDGYTGTPKGATPNNYYLHSETSGVFRMLPWGIDLTWEESIPFDAPGGLMFDRCLADVSCAGMYRDAVRQARDAIAGLDLPARVGELATLLRPWQLRDPRREYSLIEIDRAVRRVGRFLGRRPGEAAAWLGEQPPSAPLTPVPGAPPGRTPLSDVPTVPAGASPAGPRKKLKRRRKCRRKAPSRPGRCRGPAAAATRGRA